MKNMKVKLIQALLPPILGILSVLGLLILFNIIIHNGDVFTRPDKGFVRYFIPIAIIMAVIIQITITIPFLEMFKTRKKIWGLTIFSFTVLLCFISGLIFGFVFWDRDYGIIEIFSISLTGIIAFAIYWTTNLLTLKQLT